MLQIVSVFSYRSVVAVLTWQNVDTIRWELRLVTRKTGKALILPLPSRVDLVVQVGGKYHYYEIKTDHASGAACGRHFPIA